MGKALFGKQEDVKCITDIDVRGAHDEPLCLAYKTTTFHVFAGVYFRDDGYVLKIKSEDAFYPLTAATLQEQQSSGGLPTPLPPYSIPLTAYAWGYFLWIAIAIAIVWGVIESGVRKRRRAATEAMLASHPVQFGPPDLRTDGDQFVFQQVRPLLRANERVQHQAYGVDRDTDSAGSVGAAFASGLFAVLTTERVFIIKTRLGAFGVLFENRSVESIERSAIGGVALDGNTITLGLLDGTTRTLVVRPREKKLSNQAAFLRDVPRILAGAEEPAGGHSAGRLLVSAD